MLHLLAPFSPLIPLTPKNDKCLVYPHIIIAELKIKVIRMKEIIAN